MQQSLRQLILVKNFPRCLIQVVLQITATPANEYVNTKLVQASSVRDQTNSMETDICLSMANATQRLLTPKQNLLMIPALLQTALLALLSAAVPMRATATSTVAAISIDSGDSQIIMDPSPRQVDKSRSVHVLAFTSHDELLLSESEGDFTMDEWDQVYNSARKICCGSAKGNDIDMITDEDPQAGPDLRHFIRSAAEAKVTADLHWK